VSKRARGGLLSLLLFIGSLLIGRSAVADIPGAGATVSQSAATTLTPSWPTSTPTRRPTPQPTPTIQLKGTIILDENNTSVYRFAAHSIIHPLRMIARDRQVYLLDSGQLELLSLDSLPSCWSVLPPDGMVDGVPMQELADIALSSDRASILALDRAGNLFRYIIDGESWQVERLAGVDAQSDREHLISISTHDDAWYLLDANVGQLWRYTDGRSDVVPLDTDLRESADLAVGEQTFVLAWRPERAEYSLEQLSGSPLRPSPAFAPPSDLTDPSWLLLSREGDGYLYVIGKGYERLWALDPETGASVRQYRFAEKGIKIRAVDVDQGSLYVATRDAIYVYPGRASYGPATGAVGTPCAVSSELAPHDPAVLELLPRLGLPIAGAELPDMGFRLPGAPRSYRYGVHQGLDFYQASGAPVSKDTPVMAVADGRVIRADVDYVAPSAQEMDEMIALTQEVCHTPDDVLDALRGRQVWIDHGHGVVSRYAHLNAVAQGLWVGQHVEGGQLIGYVGNSGTPASYYGEELEVHLHLEIRIGDGYLGQYLRPLEVKRWLHQAFDTGA
jgi:hypothetical protein